MSHIISNIHAALLERSNSEHVICSESKRNNCKAGVCYPCFRNRVIRKGQMTSQPALLVEMSFALFVMLVEVSFAIFV